MKDKTTKPAQPRKVRKAKPSRSGWIVKTAAQLETEGAPIATLAQAAAGRRPEATHCTACGRHVSTTPDWTLWPWPDDAQLCAGCNEARHARENYADVEAAVRAGTYVAPAKDTDGK